MTWLQVNKLSFTETHTTVISPIIRNCNVKNNVINTNGVTIETVTKAKFLRVIININLTWKDHIDPNKIDKGIDIIKYVKDLFNRNTLNQ